MTSYRVQMMTEHDMYEYRSGSYNYSVSEVYVEAETPQEALDKARAAYPEMVINDYVRSKEEIEIEEAARVARENEEQAKKAARDIRKAEKEAEKAWALGLTLPEYAEQKKLKAKARRYMAEAERMQAEVERMQKEINWRKQKAAEIMEELVV